MTMQCRSISRLLGCAGGLALDWHGDVEAGPAGQATGAKLKIATIGAGAKAVRSHDVRQGAIR